MIKKDDNCYIVDDEEYFSFLKKRKTLTKVIKKSEVKNILFGEVDYKAYISVAKKYNISYDLAKIYVDNALFLKENIDLVSAPNSVKILCEIKEFLTKLNYKKIAYFGTAGFGGQVEYYQTLFNRVKENINDTNQILGYFYCQGKMPIGIRSRYEQLIKEHPEDRNLEVSIKNFDEALKHPNKKDIEQVKEWIDSII